MASSALNKLAGESDVAAFSRIFTDPTNSELRKAYAITKASPASIEATQVAGSDVNVNDASAAYAKLEDMANSQREKAPWMSSAQAFARAFEQNPELAAKAHRRPTAVTSYPMPR